MDFKPALIKKISEMQKRLSLDEGDFKALATIKGRILSTNDGEVISEMVKIMDDLCKAYADQEVAPPEA